MTGLSTEWLLNAAGLFFASIGAILMYAYPAGSRSIVVAGGASRKYLVLSKLALGLLATGFLLQYLAVIL